MEADRTGVRQDDLEGLADLCRHLELSFAPDTKTQRLLANGRDITDQIRTPRVTMAASAISAQPVVRDFLLQTQRDLGSAGGVVFEGRDMGTVVFPRADVKFFLTADLETRALRRFHELPETAAQSLKKVQSDMMRRDSNDSSREVAPLKPAPDAIHIDSTNLSIGDVIASMVAHIHEVAPPD